VKKACSFAVLVVIFSLVANATALQPYQNYTYTYEGKAAVEPQAYIPVRVISGPDMGTYDLDNPNDIYEAADGKVYIADTGNNRIIILDSELKYIDEIKEFDNNGVKDALVNPYGVFVTKENSIYIADTDNNRIVVLNSNHQLVKIIEKPQTPLLSDNFEYKPLKVGVDYAGRVFVVCKNVNDGMIEFDPQGNFIGFFGTVKVSQNIADAFWKLIATEEQRKRMELTVPTEYSSLDVDDDGFVYGTVSAVDVKNLDSTMFIHKLNPMGNDILKREGNFAPMGDVDYTVDDKMIPKTSILCDIAVREHGIYSVLDQRMGRVFTYDEYGNLLYIFGSNGDALGQFGLCSALSSYKNDSYLVADSIYNQLVEFIPTEYGSLINQAVIYYDMREYEKSEQVWEKVLKHTSKSEIAFNGMGMNLLRNEKYRESMKYFKLASNRGLYSEAFKYYRIYLVNKYFNIVFAILIIAFAVLGVLKARRKAKGGK